MLHEAWDGIGVVRVDGHDAGLAAAEVGGEDCQGGEVVEEMGRPAAWGQGGQLDYRLGGVEFVGRGRRVRFRDGS